ncbi:MAG: hypothetical protein GF330_04925 [Candidatus Eisenbacteria bacterium]|nr:hypothetical protein [Candidatus Eisenbacteria bacterium]
MCSALRLSVVLLLISTPGLLLAASPHAETYFVAPDGSGDFPTIQAAVDAAQDGDVIELGDGVFLGDGNRDIDMRGDALTIRSRNGMAESCILDCQGSAADPHRGFVFHSGETAASRVADLKIIGGRAEFGGAIACAHSSPELRGLILSYNEASESGGGVSCEGCEPTLVECTFEQNECSVTGGGIWCDDASPSLIECRFVDNYAFERGGGMRCDGASEPRIEGGAFLGNGAGIHGGGIYFYRLSEHAAYPELDGVLFRDNRCENTGGALVTVWSSPTVTRCSFEHNYAPTNAGAVWCGGDSADPLFRNCTFHGSWGGTAGCFYCNAHCSLTLENCIISFGPHGIPVYSADGSQVMVSCSDVYGNSEGDWVQCLGGLQHINGNICEDPLFCYPQDNDLTLEECSPCAPFTPPNEECDLIGAWPVGCGGSPVTTASWGMVKALFRE